ncbi:hypothetical protein KVA01_19320 [Kocuria varians]|uniref:Uncharacterized protein n=1 Tax=Kocuria varians TaxID=1272 RepID=A0A4Y4D904_KOCVA|nr:hypothetical protein KVA01_19320 [Kocuria varians]
MDLPEPLGPTTAVTPGSKWNVVADAKDLKPRTVRVFKCTPGVSCVRGAASGRQGAAGPGSGRGVRGWLPSLPGATARTRADDVARSRPSLRVTGGVSWAYTRPRANVPRGRNTLSAGAVRLSRSNPLLHPGAEALHVRFLDGTGGV